jgi:dipeptide/tripeptide permease
MQESQTKRFPLEFYIANGMEIFERLAWYGFFTVSSLYMTSPVANGGMGFSDQQRGVLQGIIPFLLYLLPVFTGTLGDRYGYKRMFLIAFIIMTPGYYLLGWASNFTEFFLVFLLVAIGAAIFKPLVVATVSHSTNDSNRGLGFGIFYMMVNIGGFLGPLIAGYVRVISWDKVFFMASIWMVFNFLLILFYRDPNKLSTNKSDSFKSVMLEMQRVLGNARLALLVVPVLVITMFFGAGWINWVELVAAIVGLAFVNLIWNRFFVTSPADEWYRQPIKVGNRIFILYILILAGYWMIYQQIFITLPLYLRDFVDSNVIVQALGSVSPALAEAASPVNQAEIIKFINNAVSTGWISEGVSAQDIRNGLLEFQLKVPLDVIQSFNLATNSNGSSISVLADGWIREYRQVSPEYLLSLNFFTIVLFQVLISLAVRKLPVFIVLMSGTLMIVLSFLISGFASSFALGGMMIIGAIILFSLGETLSSPKSQEYVASIAPKHQAGMFMGYYFVSMAIGFLFAGLLSGWSYNYFAVELGKPSWMWMLFALIGVFVASCLLLFNKFVVGPTHTGNNKVV